MRTVSRKFVASLGAGAALVVAFAGPAAAHHPEITARQVCDNGAPVIVADAEAWHTDDADRRVNDRVVVELRQGERVVESFTTSFAPAGDYQATGTFHTVAPAATYTVAAISVAPWGPHHEYGSQGESRTTTITTTAAGCELTPAAVTPPVVDKPVAATPPVVASSVVLERVDAPPAPVVLAFTGAARTMAMAAAACALIAAGAALTAAGRVARRVRA